MIQFGALDQISLTGFFVTAVLVILGFLWLGMLFGRARRRRTHRKEESPAGTAAAALLALLAFLLAFTFNIGANRFELRRSLLIEQVNDINTAYLRASYLPAEVRDESRALLYEYVGLFSQEVIEAEEVPGLLRRAEEIHVKLWGQVDELLARDYDAALLKQYVDPLNEMLDIFEKRLIVGVLYMIPDAIWFGLFMVSLLAMFGVGFQFGVAGGTSMQVGLLLALTFSTVLYTIMDLDRADQGYIRIDQTPMMRLYQNLGKSRGEAPPSEPGSAQQ
ncbi:hypothetical protein [Biformimicrobium ophioploci]|uniref:DUF4239 domain-containing protein n=1 Tax=Biformimicrobium ophioploci TaxID=3036711 RepID=A0ABQ6LXK6_9GAMM|nr:hypothetical protein [Microbulbifer sp. NKW57]GMG86796.1 hypothetical protein MNKW57_11170 [Microbulbifer sp. NKW57]